MLINSQFLAFLGIATVLTLTPGADTMLVIRNVLARGQRAGYLTGLGICSGLFVHATLSALGLSLILVRSAALFEVVKMVGACYLICLGIWSIWQMLRTRFLRTQQPQNEPTPIAPVSPTIQHTANVSGWRSYRDGLLTNVLNPKVAIFYLAFLPQFISPGDPVLAKSLFLAAVHAFLGVIWLSSISVFLGKLRKFVTRPTVQRGLEAVAGTVLIAFGIRLALAQR